MSSTVRPSPRTGTILTTGTSMIRAHFLTACIVTALFGCGAGPRVGDDEARAAAAEDTMLDVLNQPGAAP